MKLPGTHFKRCTLLVSTILASATFSGAALSQVKATDAYTSQQASQRALNYDIPAVSERQSAGDSATITVNRFRFTEIISETEQAPLTDSELSSIASDAQSKSNNRFSFESLQALADKMTAVFRDRGELLTRVVIPAQQVSGGEVTLAVLRGKLGDVTSLNSKMYDADDFEVVFEEQKGKVIQREPAESALLRVQNQLPGVSSIGVFRPGTSLGEANLVLEVTDEQSVEGFAFVDNYGSQFAGKIRAGLRTQFNNVFGGRDRLITDIVFNEKPDGENDRSSQCCIGGFNWEALTPNLKHGLGIEWFKSDYELGDVDDIELARLGFTGESTKTRVFGNYYQTVNRRLQGTWSYGFSAITAESYVGDREGNTPILLNRDELAEFDLSYQFTRFTEAGDVFYGSIGAVWEVNDGLLVALPTLLGWDKNANNDPTAEGYDPTQPEVRRTRLGTQDSNPVRFVYDLTYDVRLAAPLRAKLRVQGQYSDAVLVPVQQLSLGGPTTVRAYPVGAYVADSASVASADLILQVTSRFSAGLFYDHGYANNNGNSQIPDVSHVNLGGYGLAFNYTFDDYLTFSMSVAKASGVDNGEETLGSDSGGREAVGRDDPQVFASLRINF
ncbi:ShlB/FhaC/HecB family hemolysin secretion/activation protein [Aestuariibacter salexigens]|uniref:ShlB/FhaC/HecB family hemolysin secretion/activation protein n=1 Tax=Aestuariibacter salexigens TaxID=226010 RepID=UPI00041E2967|nr:ShlB/FhaC/HecB family hemolysin secretion/activation protein [Aestuariibacter salexigens]